MNAVTGKASYEGGARGVYVNNVFKSDGSPDRATSGHFKADAMLTAYFGGMMSRSTCKNTITGTIDNFQLSGGEANMWEVKLKSVDFTVSDGTASGTADGGGTDKGSFSANFRGSVAEVDGVVPKPHSVVGEFNSYFVNGSVAGAFGARIEEDE